METKPEIFKTYLNRWDDDGEEVSLPVEISFYYTPGDASVCDNPAYEESVEIVKVRVGAVNVSIELTEKEETKLELEIREDIHDRREESEAAYTAESRESQHAGCFSNRWGKAVSMAD